MLNGSIGSIFLSNFFWIHIRLGNPDGGQKVQKQIAQYVGCARQRIVLESAARAWAQGVPWADALNISQKAVKKADATAKALPKKRAGR